MANRNIYRGDQPGEMKTLNYRSELWRKIGKMAQFGAQLIAVRIDIP
jgi:hypothetical protein